MSKKAVINALEALDRGETHSLLLEILQGVTATFIQRRLSHHIRSQDEYMFLSERLWMELFSSQPPQRPKQEVNAESNSESPLSGENADDEKPSPMDKQDETQPERDLPPSYVSLENPEEFLNWLDKRGESILDLSEMKLFEAWGIVAAAALARQEQETPLQVVGYDDSGAGKFAFALGLSNSVIGKNTNDPGEPGRTAKLRRLTKFVEIEKSADEISRLIVKDQDHNETRLVVKYVLIELLRNVIQHSGDRLGAVVAAQRMDHNPAGQSIQVAVADCGIGIYEAMVGVRPNLVDTQEALAKALWPHVSGTFVEGLSGSQQNAGLGLFFISEMAKLTGGRLLLASRGDALLLIGDSEGRDNHPTKFLGSGRGFSGTLVAFELPIRSVSGFDDLIKKINDRASERLPKRAQHGWIRYDLQPPGAQVFLIRFASEDTAKAKTFAEEHLEPRILRKESIVLDFEGMEIATQSFLHALLFEPLRLAWAKQTHIYVINTKPAVKSGFELLEGYALGG